MEEILSSSFMDLLSVAEGVQTAVDNGRWSYLAVISIFILIEIYKKKNPNIKKKAAIASGSLGAVTGAIGASAMGSDPISGAVGGLLVGNAASGLSSFIKAGREFLLGDYLLAFKIALKVAHGVSQRLEKSNRKEALKKFDEAIEATKGEKASTKELEKWFSENM